MIIKILKNTTAEDIYLINMCVLANDQYNMEEIVWAKLIQNGKVFELINSGAIIVNNGAIDLSIPLAIEHIYRMQDESQNFSYRKADAYSGIVIPIEQQMVVYQEINIQTELEIKGELVII
jgi:hypothetical protein